MKNIILILAITTSSLLAVDPYDLVKNRQTYERKQKELTQQYTDWLKIKVESTNGAEYAAYKKELDKFVKPDGNNNGNRPDKENGNILEKGKRIRINSREGEYRIGKLEKGDKIQTQYLRGIWTSYPDWEMESPENPRIAQHRLYFVIKDGDLIKVRIPILKTKEKIFEYELKEDGECFLIMGGTKVLNDNEGEVSYKVNIISK